VQFLTDRPSGPLSANLCGAAFRNVHSKDVLGAHADGQFGVFHCRHVFRSFRHSRGAFLVHTIEAAHKQPKQKIGDRNLSMISIKRAIAWLDLILAALLAAVGIFVVITANGTPPNVDAGAIAEAGAVLFMLPAALVLGLAGLALWKNWRIGWLIQVAAVVGIPVLIFASN